MSNPYEGQSVCKHGFLCALVQLDDGWVQPISEQCPDNSCCPAKYKPGVNPRTPDLFNTNEFFMKGRLSVVLDGQAGSSGKGVIGSFVTKHAVNWQFACNSFSAQAGHWVHDGEVKRFYQSLNSCAYDHERYERLLIGPGAVLEVPALLREIEENSVPARKVGISPLAAVIQEQDVGYERGQVSFEGAVYGRGNDHDGTMRTGSTCHGVGAARARRLLRHATTRLARDVPELKPFLCDVPTEVMDRLDRGQAGLLEVAQGFQLSLLGRFYPHCTSNNVTVASGLDGMMVPPRYLGNVLLNYRTFPIRINSRKFVTPDGRHLTWAEVEQGVPHRVVDGDSGGWYKDQHELAWSDVTRESGSPSPILELTSVTKLPRRVASFSVENLRESIRHNQPLDGRVFLSVNFANYVDHAISGKRGVGVDALTPKVREWLLERVLPLVNEKVVLRYVGTGPQTDDKVVLGGSS